MLALFIKNFNRLVVIYSLNKLLCIIIIIKVETCIFITLLLIKINPSR